MVQMGIVCMHKVVKITVLVWLPEVILFLLDFKWYGKKWLFLMCLFFEVKRIIQIFINTRNSRDESTKTIRDWE